MSYTAPAGNAVALPIGGGLSYSPPSGDTAALPLEDEHPAPNAVADAYDIAQNTARSVAAPGVLGNDALYTGILSSYTSPAHGTLMFNPDGSFTYTPVGGYTGSDSFTYTLGNDNGFGTATVSLTIYAAPITIGHVWYALANTLLSVAAPGVLDGCAVNGAALTGHTSPAHGTLALYADGSFDYTPTSGFTGTDTFDFTLSNYAGSSTSTITIHVELAPGAVDDAYSTTQGETLSVAAPGPLYNDDLEGAAVTLGAGPAHGTLMFNPDGSFGYTPDGGFSGSDSFTYVLTNDVGTSTGTVTIAVLALPPPHRYTQASTGMPWTEPPRAPVDAAAAWIAAPRRAAETIARHIAAPRQRFDLAIGWTMPPRKAAEVAGAWSAAPRAGTEWASPWRALPRASLAVRAAWSMPPRVEVSASFPYLSPPRRSLAVTARFTVPPRAPVGVTVPWLNPPRVQRRWWIPWGTAERIAWQPPDSPGVDVPPEVPLGPFYVPPRGDAVDLPFACLWYDTPGNEIAIPFGPFACYAASLGRRRYIVLNTAAVVRLPERTPIPVSAITLGASVGDMAWTAQITLADPALKAYLLPDGDGPKSIEININGYVWTAIIESWRTDTVFPGDTVTMSGHSRTMLLTAPYRAPRDYTQAADRNAQQLMDDELQYTGFTLDYGTVDWLVPGGVWTYQQQTALGAIGTLAAAAGAVVQSHPYDDVLQIRPRWPTSPWDWPTTSPDKIVQDDYTPQWTGTDQVSGMATYAINGLPLWPATATDKPGLLLPLHLVEFVAPTEWHAQVASVKIDAQLQTAGNGASALVVTQEIQLQAPPAEPVFDYVLVSGQQVGVSDPIIRNGRAGTTRLPQIVDSLVVTDPVALERGRNAIAGGGDTAARVNVWQALTGILPRSRYIKGNVTAINGDGSITVATSDGGTIRARPLPGQSWTIGAGVFVQDGRIVDVAPSLPGTTQYV